MEDSERSEAILALGSRLVQELGLEPSVDTLGRWMAHHVADLITKAKAARGEEKQIAERKCFDAILALWKHRAALPQGRRPHEDLEPVLRAIESLDPADDTPRYFRGVRPTQGKGNKKSDADRWLDMVNGLDYSAKILIAFCLSEAASAAIDRSAEWVRLAEAAGVEDSAPEVAVRFLSTHADFVNQPKHYANVHRQLQDRIGKLKGFTTLARAAARVLTARLEAMPVPEAADPSVDPSPLS